MSLEQKHEELFSVVAKSSENIENENLQKLKKVFPQFVKDGEVDFDAMQAFLKKEGILAGDERYGLNWSGKSNAFKAIRTPATGTLIPEKDKSKNWDETENIFIEGDNLEVLKLLQKHYREKIKMIYIDPPYNTGKDFVYKDNFTQGVSDYYEQTGQTKGGIKMTANTEKNGRYHSDWLTMMYPRLFLARNLLKDDGVIFVSIDDNEVANLRLMMDEIFGEEGFVAQIVWHKKTQPSFLSKEVSSIKEYILLYRKSTDQIQTKGGLTDMNKNIEMINISNSVSERFIRKENVCIQNNTFNGLLKKGLYGNGKLKNELIEDINVINGKPDKDILLKGRFKWTQDTMNKSFEEGDIYHIKNIESFRTTVEKKNKVANTKPILDLLSKKFDNNIPTNTDATNELKYLFDDLSPMDYPKPSKLIKYLVDAITYDDSDSVVLDFFAGSGTTAHAVMDLNSEDGGNRKWICVQLPEITEDDSDAFKTGYKTISEISRERIRRAGDKIGKGDIGFKSYKLSNSNYRKWNDISLDDERELIKQSKLFIESPLVDGFIPENVVYEIALKEGFDLNCKITQNKSDLKPYVLQDGDRKLFVTFSDKVTKEKVVELKLSQDDLFVCFDNAMSDTEKVNVGKIINLKVI